MKNSAIILLLLSIITSCAFNKQASRFIPLWWDQQVEGEISSFGKGFHADEKTSRFIAQNDAYQRISGRVAIYLNQHISENCIAPGDVELQKELDKIFRNFLNFFNNIDEPEISVGESEFVRVTISRKNNIEYFTRLFVKQEYVHTKFIEYLDTSDLYILPKLRNVLRDCFKE